MADHIWDWSDTYRVQTSWAYVGAHAGRSRRTGTKLHRVRVNTVIAWLAPGPFPVKPGQVWDAETACGYRVSGFRPRQATDQITCKKCGPGAWQPAAQP